MTQLKLFDDIEIDRDAVIEYDGKVGLYTLQRLLDGQPVSMSSDEAYLSREEADDAADHWIEGTPDPQNLMNLLVGAYATIAHFVAGDDPDAAADWILADLQDEFRNWNLCGLHNQALADLEQYYLEFGFPGDEEIIEENVDNESE